jgi:membrane fusion protein, copper/silver efflux system
VRSGDRIEIVKGLKAGDRIVTSGNFLLNSEAQMRQQLNGGTHDQQHH